MTSCLGPTLSYQSRIQQSVLSFLSCWWLLWRIWCNLSLLLCGTEQGCDAAECQSHVACLGGRRWEWENMCWTDSMDEPTLQLESWLSEALFGKWMLCLQHTASRAAYVIFVAVSDVSAQVRHCVHIRLIQWQAVATCVRAPVIPQCCGCLEPLLTETAKVVL